MGRPRKDISGMSEKDIQRLEKQRIMTKARYERTKRGRGRPPKSPKIDESRDDVIICYGKIDEFFPGEFGSVYEELNDKVFVYKRWNIFGEDE